MGRLKTELQDTLFTSAGRSTRPDAVKPEMLRLAPLESYQR